MGNYAGVTYRNMDLHILQFTASSKLEKFPFMFIKREFYRRIILNRTKLVAAQLLTEK